MLTNIMISSVVTMGFEFDLPGVRFYGVPGPAEQDRLLIGERKGIVVIYSLIN